MASQSTPLLIVGTGAMASLFAAKLAASGLNVRMLGTWAESIDSLNKFGVRYIDEYGQESVYPVEATDDPGECIGSQYAIVLVKSSQTEKIANNLATCMAKDGLALTLQNGLDNHGKLVDALGEERVASGVTTVGATLIEPGLVRTGGKGVISLGQNSAIDILVDHFIQAGFEVERVANTDSLLWGKLVINASINPLTAILRVPNGDLLTNSFARIIMKLVTIETAEVASANQVELPYSDPVAVVESVAQRTASNHSSMYKDVLRGSQTEIDAINGAIVRVGEEVSASIEYNRMLWLLVNAIQVKSSI